MRPIHRNTYLVLKKNKVMATHRFLETAIWSKSVDQLRKLYAQVGAADVEFSIQSHYLLIGIWADDPRDVKDHVCAAASGFWKTFHERMDEFSTRKLADIPCPL